MVNHPAPPVALVQHCLVQHCLVQPGEGAVLQDLAQESAAAQERGAGRGTAGTADLVMHLDAAHNLARWLTGNSHDAEDIVQDAYLKAFRYRSSLRGSEVRPWLLAIVRNNCYDFLRRKQISEKDRAFDEELHSAGQETLNPETSALQRDRSVRLREALAELPVAFREVLVLRDLEELSYQEIASVARIPIGTVMSRLNRARKQVQSSMLLQLRVTPQAPAAVDPAPAASQTTGFGMFNPVGSKNHHG
jgi:RNA polymerase sigma-70 factor (ECF subfamily)